MIHSPPDSLRSSVERVRVLVRNRSPALEGDPPELPRLLTRSGADVSDVDAVRAIQHNWTSQVGQSVVVQEEEEEE